MQVSPVMSISKLCLDSNNNLRRWITTDSGLEITIGQAPDTLSGQT